MARDPVEQTALGLLITQAMADQGLTVRAAARRCGIAPGTLSHYKVGRIKGEAESTLRKIGKGLGIPVDQLLDAAGVERRESDIDTLIAYWRRLPVIDRGVLVDVARALARAARERGLR